MSPPKTFCHIFLEVPSLAKFNEICWPQALDNIWHKNFLLYADSKPELPQISYKMAQKVKFNVGAKIPRGAFCQTGVYTAYGCWILAVTSTFAPFVRSDTLVCAQTTRYTLGAKVAL